MWLGKVKSKGSPVLCFGASGQTLYTLDFDGAVAAWDTTSQQPTRLFTVANHEISLKELTIALTGDTLLVNSENYQEGTRLYAWDLAHGDFFRLPGAGTDGSALFARQTCLWPCFDPLGNRLFISNYTTNQIACLDWPSLRPLVLPDTFRVTTYSMIASGDRLAAFSADEFIQVWDLTTLDPVARIECVAGAEPTPMAFSPDRARLAVGSRGGVTVFDLCTSASALEIPHKRSDVLAVAYHPSGRILATGGASKAVEFWDGTTGQRLTAFDWKIGTVGAVQSLTFSPDGLTCAAGGEKGKFVVWDVDL